MMVRLVALFRLHTASKQSIVILVKKKFLVKMDNAVPFAAACRLRMMTTHSNYACI